MDATTAALIGAAVGVIGTLGAALVNPFTTAKKAHQAKLYELRREAYVAAIAYSAELWRGPRDPETIRAHAQGMFATMATLSLFGNKKVAALYEQLYQEVRQAARMADEGKPLLDAGVPIAVTIRRFIDAARADIGSDKID